MLAAGRSVGPDEAVSAYVGRDADRFNELVAVFLKGDHPIAQRAANVLVNTAAGVPDLIRPHFDLLLDVLDNGGVHNAVTRNIIRVMQFVDVPDELDGRAFDICLRMIDDPREPSANRAFAITAAARIAKGEPDLLREVGLVLENHRGDLSAAVLSRARKLFDGGRPSPKKKAKEQEKPEQHHQQQR